MATTPTHYKPSPLSFNSPRTSPFRRQDSSHSRSPSTLRASAPTTSPLKQSHPPTGPSPSPSPSPSPLPQTPSAERPSTPLRNSTTTNLSANPWLTTRGTTATPEPADSPTRNQKPSSSTVRPAGLSPAPSTAPTVTPYSATTRPRPSVPRTTTASTIRPAHNPSDPLAHIPPALLHSMRESFAVLDRHNTGSITRDDVASMLGQLGLPDDAGSLDAYLGPSSTITLPAYLNNLAVLLAPLSSASELSAAFSAFDVDDSGQIDVEELRDALMHTAPETGGRGLGDREMERIMQGFTGRRAFGKDVARGLGRGEVFRYQEFVAAVRGGAGAGAGGEEVGTV
ncbi:hypothetical protein M501DRAFT_977285 [Patellaria atrata CBS 101060]|uniref:EF-hand domain-containing protein n=1 Tax=Patellaria atrata CBS 101060 TaxID=1346257 RepID=A0A9P4S8K9_9PEZI|nr:hypothetical protein M501DRAFT_977285 [Patellaria atrata CBS 101060]